MKLRSKMITILTIPVSLGLIGLTIFSSLLVQKDMRESVLEMSEEVVLSRALDLASWVEVYRVGAQRTANEAVMRSGDPEKMKAYILSRQSNLDAHQDFEFVAFRDGNFLASSGDTGNVSHRDYFQAIMDGKDFVVSDVLSSVATGRSIFTVSVPVRDMNDRIIGIVSSAVRIEHLSQMMGSINIGEAFGTVLDGDLTVIAHPDPRYVRNLNLAEPSKHGYRGLDERIGDVKSGIIGNARYLDAEGLAKYLIYAPIPGTSWAMTLTVPETQINAAANEVAGLLVLVSLIILGVLVTVVALSVNSMVKPIRQMSVLGHRIAAGELFMNAGDRLSFDKARKMRDEVGEIAESFNELVTSLVDTVRSISVSSGEVEKGAGAISVSSQQLSQGAAEQASNAEEVSATVEEISSTVRQSADNALTTESITHRALADAEAGAEAVLASVESMKEIVKKDQYNR